MKTPVSAGLMAPREHGAWGMLLLPFFSALFLAGRMTWEVLPAGVVAVGGVALARLTMAPLYRLVL